MIDMLVNYTGLSRETIVNLLPFVLMEIRNYTNQYFLTETNIKILNIVNNTINSVGNADMFQVGDTVELLNSENNTMIYQIKSITDNVISFEQPIITETNNKNIVMIKLSFKNVNLKTISGMLTYQEKFGTFDGIQSQTLGGYNVSYAKPSNGETAYPQELYGGINSLRKLNDDFAEYRRKGYVRIQ